MPMSDFDQLVRAAKEYETAALKTEVRVPAEFRLNPEDNIRFDYSQNPEQLINYYLKIRKLTAAVYYEQSVLQPELSAPEKQAPVHASAGPLSFLAKKGTKTGGQEDQYKVSGSGLRVSRPQDLKTGLLFSQKREPLEREKVKEQDLKTFEQQPRVADASSELYRKMIDEKYGAAGKQLSTEQTDVIKKMELARGFAIEEMRRYDEIATLPDYKLVEYARMKDMAIYNRLGVGAITPDEFRLTLKKNIARERGLDSAYFDKSPGKKKITVADEVKAFSELAGTRKGKGK